MHSATVYNRIKYASATTKTTPQFSPLNVMKQKINSRNIFCLNSIKKEENRKFTLHPKRKQEKSEIK